MLLEKLLSKKAYNCLSRNSINTILELKKSDKKFILNIRGMGLKSLTEIMDLLKIKGNTYQEKIQNLLNYN